MFPLSSRALLGPLHEPRPMVLDQMKSLDPLEPNSNPIPSASQLPTGSGSKSLEKIAAQAKIIKRLLIPQKASRRWKLHARGYPMQNTHAQSVGRKWSHKRQEVNDVEEMKSSKRARAAQDVISKPLFVSAVDRIVKEVVTNDISVEAMGQLRQTQ